MVYVIKNNLFFSFFNTEYKICFMMYLDIFYLIEYVKVLICLPYHVVCIEMPFNWTHK